MQNDHGNPAHARVIVRVKEPTEKRQNALCPRILLTLSPKPKHMLRNALEPEPIYSKAKSQVALSCLNTSSGFFWKAPVRRLLGRDPVRNYVQNFRVYMETPSFS